MAAKNTSVVLGDHFETYVSGMVKSGRYSNASEVVRDGLRRLERDDMKLTALRKRLELGERQIKKGKFAKDFSYESLMKELDEEFATATK